MDEYPRKQLGRETRVAHAGKSASKESVLRVVLCAEAKRKLRKTGSLVLSGSSCKQKVERNVRKR